ncbi:MAG: TerC family protein [Methylacidiphilales bacterium]|nr:TerC family protein [Candidatus Methylacidiphilales bacterium]
MPPMETPFSFWLGFNIAVAVLLVLDLTILRMERRAPSLRESILTTLVWVALAVGFGVWLAGRVGWEKGSEFFTGYVIEYSLSVDNLFLFVLIFSNFNVAPEQQRRLLFWGVIGALIMRGAMIGAGVALLQSFEWVIYLFGAYIIYAGFGMLFHRKSVEVEKLTVVRLARHFLPFSSADQSGAFVVREDGRLKLTMLFLVLVAVEFTDLVFALDSIPAIFGVTRDPFIVYTSNVCAVLGLRSLYFVLAGAVKNLVYLRYGLAFVLIFIGVKMTGEHFLPISTDLSLIIVGGILGVAVVASLLKTKLEGQPPA